MVKRSVIKIGCTVALLAVVACGDDDPNNGGMGGPDGSTMDGGGSDAGDGGVDGSRADTGVRDDAGPNDAGTADADTMDASPDVGEDASLDATLADAGSNDASSVDGGDSGNAADAGDAGADAAPPLAAWYKFDEDAGTVAAESTGSIASATLENGATWTTGRVGGAVDLAGGAGNAANNYVSLPPAILDNCEDVTVALWMNLGSIVPWARILDVEGTPDAFLFFTPTQGSAEDPRLFFNIYYPAGEGANDQGVSAAYPVGTTLVGAWHHVAFTLSQGTGTLYFDGAEIGAGPMMLRPSDLPIGATAHAWLGRSRFDVDAYLDATLDELHISCTALSAEEIAALAQ